MLTELRRGRHSISDLKVHLVCVTKYRRPVLTTQGLNLIEDSFKQVAAKMDCRLLEFNGEADHIHALVEYPPKLSISTLVNSLKGVSSRQYGKAGFPKPIAKRRYGVPVTLLVP